VGLVNAARLPAVFLNIYGFAWFAGFAISFVAYIIFRKLGPNS
jgi:cytosine/uracil/thiamine/allantoin permease